MNGKSKKLLMGALTLTASACMAISLTASLQYAQANAQTAETEFFVENGASVRTEEGTSGIRFTTKISQDLYQSVKEQGGTWGAIIGYEVKDASTLNAEKVDDNYVRFFEPKNASGEAVTITPALKDGYYIYNTVITYNKLSEENFVTACNMPINVRAFYKVGESYEYSTVAADADTYRSITQVAERVLVNDKLGLGWYDEVGARVQKNILKEYTRAKTGTTVTSNDLAYSKDLPEEKAITGVTAPNGVYLATINGQEVEGVVTVNDGTVALTSFPELTLGEKYTLVLQDFSNTYLQGFKYVSDTIDDLADFINATKRYGTGDTYNTNKITPALINTGTGVLPEGFEQRYYVLTDDIVSTGAYDFSSQWNNHWFDILDGQGYAINVNSVAARGLFGYIDVGGVVKNCSITVNKSISASANAQINLLAYGLRYNATVENVSIHFNFSTATPNYYKLFGYMFYLSALTDVYVYYNDNATIPEANNQSYGYLTNYFSTGNTNAITRTYVVSSKIKQACYYPNELTSNLYAKNDEIPTVEGVAQGKVIPTADLYRYDTVAKLKETGVTKVGDWQINDDGTATWMGTDGYTPEYTPAGETEKELIKSEHIVNSNEVNLTANEDGTFDYGTLKIEATGLPAGYTTVYFNGEAIENATVSDTTVSIPVANIPEGFVLGDINEITVKNDSGDEFVQPFRYISGEISNATQFQNMLYWYTTQATSKRVEVYSADTFRQRYYVLTADITGFATQWDSDFYDVFDGQGHSITVSANRSRGLFGIINPTAIVKNVAIKLAGSMEGSNSYQATPVAMFVKGTLDNVYVDFAPTSNKSFRHHILGGWIYSSATLNNVYVHTADDVSHPTDSTDGYGVLGALGSQIDSVTLNNVYVVSKNIDVMLKTTEPTYRYASNESTTDKVGLNGVYRYETATAMQGANVTQVGNWVIGADGTATFDASSYANAGFTVEGSTSEHLVMKVEDAVQVTATNEGATLAIKSANESIVTVAEEGWLVAVSAGKTVVSVTVDGETKLVYVEVEAIRADEITATVTANALTVGGTASVNVSLGGMAFGGYIAYALSAEEVITVENGEITAVGAGEVTLSVAYQLDGVVRVKDFVITVTAE